MIKRVFQTIHSCLSESFQSSWKAALVPVLLLSYGLGVYVALHFRIGLGMWEYLVIPLLITVSINVWAVRWLMSHDLAGIDPTGPGPWPVLTTYYGSGTDQRREEYGAKVELTTPTVDATVMLSGTLISICPGDSGDSAGSKDDYRVPGFLMLAAGQF